MIEEHYAIDTTSGPSLWLIEIPDPPPTEPPAPSTSPLAVYWAAVGYLAAGGVLAAIGEALRADMPTLLALWLIMGAWLWALWAMSERREGDE